MNNSQSYLVFIVPEIAPFMESVGIFEISQINNCNYIACSKINESSHFLDLIISQHHLWNQTDYDFLISLPYQSVVYICSAQGSDLNKILGFRNISKDANNPPGELSL